MLDLFSGKTDQSWMDEVKQKYTTMLEHRFHNGKKHDEAESVQEEYALEPFQNLWLSSQGQPGRAIKTSGLVA